jgi:nucleobase:cation symporter-1, NCS1 family
MTAQTGGGALQIEEADKAWKIEQHAIDPIPAAERHGTPVELFRLWIGANINYVTLVAGSLIYAKGLSFLQCLTAICVGNAVGCTLVGLCSIMGPKTGSAGIVTSRTSFGQRGALVPMAISLVSVLSWFSIQSVVATQCLEELLKIWGFAGSATIWVALGIVLSAEILLALYGHATIIAAEKWIAWVLALLFVGFAWFVVPHVLNFTTPGLTRPEAPFTTWLVCIGIILSCPIGWANFASDYSRYFPPNTSWKRIAWCAGSGQFVALAFCQVIGVLFAVALNGALGDDPVSQLGRFMPTWFIVPLLLAIVLSAVAANVPNGYTAALGMLALRVPITRAQALGVIAVFTLIVRIIALYYGQFYELYQRFLAYLVFWTMPWAAIVITDYFMRNGRYNTRDLMRWGTGEYWYRNGYAWAGILAFVIGTCASIACSYSEAYESPLARALFGGADLSFEVGLVVPALIYWSLARGMENKNVTPGPAFGRAHSRP